jgi:hypothetical protein
MQTLLADDARDLYAFSRSHAGEHVVVALNNDQVSCEVTLPLIERFPGAEWRTLFAMDGVRATDNAQTIILPPKSGIVLGTGGNQ